MTTNQANKIYDVLEEYGAWENMRDDFIFHHVTSKDKCNEWRFQGKLGYGGKYYSRLNRVDCYSEDYNDRRKAIINEINEKLRKLIINNK